MEIAIDWILFIWKRDLTIAPSLIVHWLLVILLPHFSSLFLKVKSFLNQ